MNDMQQFLKGFKEGMKNFGSNIAVIVNSILLILVYFIGVGLTSLFAKLIGKRFIQVKISKEMKTYWSDLNLKKKPIESYYKQF